MASRGNYYAELLDDQESPETTTVTAKKQEKKQKLDSALQQQKKSAKGKQTKQEQHPAHGFEPHVDAARPEKRVFDRQSGTGRGKEVSKQGHKGWGKEDDVKVMEEAKAEALEEIKPEEAKKEEQPEEKKEETKKEEEDKPKEAEKPKKVQQLSLDQYFSKINSEKIRIEERGPRGTEIQPAELPSEYKLLHDRTDKPRTTEMIPVNKPQKKQQPKQEHKKAEKPAPKTQEKAKEPAKDGKKQKNEPAQKGKKEQKKDNKKEEKKPVPAPEPVAEPKKKEKKPEDMTTADFFKGVPRQPRTFESKPRPRAPSDEQPKPLYQQVWRRAQDGQEVMERRELHEREGEAPRQAGQPAPRRGKQGRFDSTAFPELGGKPAQRKEQKPAEHKEAAPTPAEAH